MGNEHAPERVESAKAHVGADSAAGMRQEAGQGFSNFSDVRTAMTSNTANVPEMSISGSDKPQTTNAAIADPALKNGGTADSKPKDFERDPENSDQFNTPVITPRDLQRRRAEDPGRVIEEGKSPSDSRPGVPSDQAEQKAEAATPTKLEDLNTRVSSEVDKDGNLKSVTSELGDSSTKFDFNKDGGVTRTTTVPDGTEVSTFDADGKPVSRQVTAPDGKVVSNDLNPDDSVKVLNGSDGKPAAIVSDQSGAKTVLEIGKDGKVTDRSIATDGQSMVTEFNGEGEATRNFSETKDDKGNVTREINTKDSDVVEKLDPSGKVIESETATDDKTTTMKVLKDGGTMTVEETDNATNTVITDKDGKVILKQNAAADGSSAVTEMNNPDGSNQKTIETRDSISSMTRRPDGSWESTDTSKRSGHTVRKVGSSPDDPGAEQRDT